MSIGAATETKPEGLRVVIDKPGLLWLDLDEPMDPALDELARRYQFHELAVEDCRNPIQLAKIDQYDEYCFIIINTTHYTEDPCQVRTREIDIFLGADYIVTVHFGRSMAVDDVAKRLAPISRHQYPDMILHALIDIVVDRYLPTLDQIGDTIDSVQDALLVSPEPKLLETMFDLKRGLLHFRRAVSSQRELLNALIRDETSLIRQEMRIYFRDVYDHAVRAMDLVETYRDLLTGGLDIYLTQMANRTNNVVKALTVLATIMLPLTLITGYFGMNFDYIPLLKHHFGIGYVTIFMLAIAVGMLSWFKYKRWI